MKKIIQLLVIFYLLFEIQIYGFQGNTGNIVYPWRAVSSIVKSGDNFEILFNNVISNKIDSVILEGPFNRVILTIDAINTGKFEYDTYSNASANNRILARVPKSAPEELYNLIIKSGGEVYKSPKSVKVVREFKTNHCFIHVSDLHVSREWVGTAENGYAKELELLHNFIKVANIISPDFVIITGDNIHNVTYIPSDSTNSTFLPLPMSSGWLGTMTSDARYKPSVEEKWKNYYEGSKGFLGIYGFNAPTFSVAGNHDFYGMPINDHKNKVAQWNQFCGKRVYGFSYAGTRIIAADNFLGDTLTDIPAKSPMSGLQGEVLESFLKNSGKGSLLIMAQHRPDIIDTAFCNKNGIAILLNGHLHKPFYEYIGTTPTLSIRPGTVSKSGTKDSEGELGLFRIFRINGNTFSFTEPLKFCKDPTQPYRKLELNLRLDYENLNDGTSTNNKAVVVNQLGIDLPECNIRFVMKKGKYKVNNGVIYQIIESGNYSVIDVKVDVKKEKPTEIVITKS